MSDPNFPPEKFGVLVRINESAAGFLAAGYYVPLDDLHRPEDEPEVKGEGYIPPIPILNVVPELHNLPNVRAVWAGLFPDYERRFIGPDKS